MAEVIAERKMEVLSAKTKTRIGFWNVRTMYETGKLAQVIAEVQPYKLHILGVSESRWTGSGRQTTTTGETVLYLGREDNQHHERVASDSKEGNRQVTVGVGASQQSSDQSQTKRKTQQHHTDPVLRPNK